MRANLSALTSTPSVFASRSSSPLSSSQMNGADEHGQAHAHEEHAQGEQDEAVQALLLLKKAATTSE